MSLLPFSVSLTKSTHRKKKQPYISDWFIVHLILGFLSGQLCIGYNLNPKSHNFSFEHCFPACMPILKAVRLSELAGNNGPLKSYQSRVFSTYLYATGRPIAKANGIKPSLTEQTETLCLISKKDESYALSISSYIKHVFVLFFVSRAENTCFIDYQSFQSKV